jgi:N-methylhydantoinase A/oxoprolinase/acetone carboxylase beta subunit
MEQSKTIHLIACGVLAPDMKRIAAELNIPLTMTFLPGGLHNQPEELGRRLQQAIDEAAQVKECERIIIGYGICGRGTVGIKAPHVPLVLPRVHDCIALFMGSDQAYKKEFSQHPGTFYLSAGWYREKGRPSHDEDRKKIWIGGQSLGCRELKDKYGEQAGRRIIDFFSTWHHNYNRAAFIDTGTDKALAYEEYAREMAREHDWQFARIEGDLSLMTRLLTQDHSDDQLLVVPPGHFTIYSPFANGLDSAPRLETAVPSQSEVRRIIHDEETDDGLAIRYGLGIDAGGTYTDAVIWDFQWQKILHKHKALTTKWDFAIGIDNVLSGLDSGLLSMVELVSVSTTLATNAIVEGEGQKTGLLLMDGGMADDKLISHTPRYMVKGYINISGEEIEPVDEEEIRAVARKIVQRDGVTAFAVSGFAGSINPAHELAVKRIIEDETGMVTCCGHEFSDLLNFVVRAQTAVFNARIIPRMIKFFRELKQVLEKRRITAPVMVVKGDGTLMADAMARERPVETTLSGPAASVAGAKLLTGLRDAMVVDMGGTTTDTADICDGMVAICASGAHVGGVLTHVKALDMRTSGLGGDSLIHRHASKEEFAIGPRRVGPLAWAGHISEGSISNALRFMEQQPGQNLDQVVFVAMEGQFPFEPTELESTIYQLLRQRPHAPEELTAKLNVMSTLFLPMARMEESGLVQRCGLTPTDLLHVRGDFTRWDAEPAARMLAMLSSWTNKPISELIDELLGKIHQQLAFELLKKQLFKDISEEEAERSPVVRQLLLQILEPEKPDPTSRYRLKAELQHPVIGIGAPVQYFLPQAGKLVNTEVIIPPDADVANALGAITSRIMIKRKLVICPNSLGRFVVEGAAGNQTFKDIAEAEAWSVEYLKERVRATAKKAGTTRKTVAIEIDDRVIDAGNGLSLFLHRSITATLQGSPDLILAAAGAADPRVAVVQS